jgi:hypothetical protein
MCVTVTTKDDYEDAPLFWQETDQKRACRDICLGDHRKGMFMNSLLNWLTNAHSPPPMHDGREWIAATYEDWEKRRPCGKKNPITKRQLRDLVAELVKDGLLLKSRHRSAYHGYKTVLHLALSDSFGEEASKWGNLGADRYRSQRISAKPRHAPKPSHTPVEVSAGTWSSVCRQLVAISTVSEPSLGRHSVVNSYKSLIVGESENQSLESELRLPAYAGISRPFPVEDSDSDSGKKDEIDESSKMAIEASVALPWQLPVETWYADDAEEEAHQEGAPKSAS